VSITLQWRPLNGVRGGTESTGRRFEVRAGSVGGMVMVDRREKRRYTAPTAEPLRKRAEKIVADESIL
jgi:hypothetical protein